MTEISDTLRLVALVPLLPLAVAALLVFLPRERRGLAGTLAIAGQALAFLCAVIVFFRVAGTPTGESGVFREVFNFNWFEFGATALPLGLLIDPLNAAMLVMVCLVGLLVCIYSVAYMAEDDNAARFFCFISFFSAAMLGLLVSNSLLLLFVCWELVGLASYLLIGFWFHKPSAAAAARKAFIVTRIGDIGFFLGMIFLYQEAGTLLFYDGGAGVLEAGKLALLAAGATIGGLALSNAIALLLFCGAAGKSGQFPFHVWLPDAMEGPTPVSALIHAATMVAAGVFLVARAFPLFEAAAGADGSSLALTVVTWVGAGTALLAACIAVAQTDIKRILAYSTVSQLGFMMLCLGVGGVAAALFHLIAHAFFKALLFLGAGSVIHGCHENQDIRTMGGLRRRMPLTFATYAIGMMALAGFPFFFSGFWSKEAILHLVHEWPVSHLPFVLALCATFLTAFYMSRQMLLVFFGEARTKDSQHAHESPRLMTLPLTVLAVGAILPGFLATPAWPWFEHFIEGGKAHVDIGHLFTPATLMLMVISIVLVAAGVTFAWLLYGRSSSSAAGIDPLEQKAGRPFRALARGLYIDEFYAATVVRGTDILGQTSAWLDRWIWGGGVRLVAALCGLASRLVNAVDRRGLNRGFDLGCQSLRGGGQGLNRAHSGNLQYYLTTIGAAAVLLLLLLAWL